MNLSAIFSKTGKGVQESSGKTSDLSRGDRAVLSAIDGKTSLAEVQKKFEKLAGPKFEALIQQFDKDGYIREVSSGAQSAAPSARPAAPVAKAAPPPKADDGDEALDFTQAIKIPTKAPAAPKPPPVDLAAASRADAERKAKEQQAFDYKSREEAEAKAKAEAELKARAAAAAAKARAEAEATARAAAEAKAKAEAEAKVRAEAEAKSRLAAEADAKVRLAREAAVSLATEAKARAEADARAKSDAAERDKARLEAELNAKLDAERKAREDAERRAAGAVEQARKELEEKATRDAEELRQRLEEQLRAEMKAKLDEERKAREAEDRKRREEEDRRRKEEDEERAREDVKRRAREEADRKKREEEDRRRKEEDDRRRKDEDERRAKEVAERRIREEADREKRAEEDRKRREEDEHRRKEEDERRAKDDAERRARDDAERKAREEAEAKTRAAASAAASLPRIETVSAPPPPPPPATAAAPAGGDIGDSLLADLDSFGKREEEEQQAKEEAERKAKEEAARRAKDDAERRAKEEAARRAKDEAEKKRREEEEKRAQEEAERKEREQEARRKEEEAERKRKAKEALAAKQAEERAARAAAKKGSPKDAAGGDEVDVAAEDLDGDDIKRDQKALAARSVAREREQASVSVATGRPRKLGKPVAIALFLLLLAGVGLLHVMPVSTAEYERAASEAMGVPVKVGSARLSVITGIEMNFEGVSIGNAVKIRQVRAFPEVGSLFGAKKSFSRVELEGVSVSQSQVADALLGKVAGENFRVGRVVIKQLNLDGSLKLPPLDVDATVAGDGSLQSVKLSGGDKLLVQLSPKGSEIGFEISAGSLALPFVPALNLADFGMKGTANRAGVTAAEFDGRAFDGVINGTARIRWGSSWTVEGEVRARAVKIAVFAPALVSEGKVEGRAAYNMSGVSPALLYEGARMQGEFKIDKGVLGSFDLTRALQTGGAQTTGRTVFNELNGQGVYDKGTVQLRNIAIVAGAMNAGASVDIDANGGISGRVSADVKTPNQTLRAILNISGKLQDPVIRK